MDYQFNIFSWILFLTGAIGLAVAAVAWSKKNSIEQKFLALMELSVSIWGFTGALEMAATNIELKLLWSQLSYVGITGTIISYFLLALAFGRYYRFLTKRNIFLILIVPAISIVLVATNNQHHSFYTHISLDHQNNLAFYEHGIFFWLFTFYSYLLLFIGLIVLIKAIIKFPSIYKSQIIILITGAIFPFSGNLMYIFNLNPIPGVDWTPIGFGVSGVILIWGIIKYRMLDLIPIGHHKLIQTMKDGIMVIDNHHKIININPAMEKITRISAKEVLGNSAEAALSQYPELVKSIFNNNQKEICLKNGKISQYYNIQKSQLKTGPSKPQGILIVLHNITNLKNSNAELKASETKLRILSNQLLDANILKGTLLDVITHDLKNPIWALKGYSDILNDSLEDSEIIKGIRDGSKSLLDVLNYVTTLSRVTLGDKIEMENLDFVKIIKEVQKEYIDRFTNREMELELQLPEKLEIRANPIISQAIKNYLNNAIKYASEGKKVIIYAKQEKGKSILRVIDYGAVIPEKERETIFERSAQYDSDLNKRRGLGLAIVKRIALAHGANFGVMPNHPHGNIFFLEIPV